VWFKHTRFSETNYAFIIRSLKCWCIGSTWWSSQPKKILCKRWKFAAWQCHCRNHITVSLRDHSWQHCTYNIVGTR